MDCCLKVECKIWQDALVSFTACMLRQSARGTAKSAAELASVSVRSIPPPSQRLTPAPADQLPAQKKKARPYSVPTTIYLWQPYGAHACVRTGAAKIVWFHKGFIQKWQTKSFFRLGDNHIPAAAVAAIGDDVAALFQLRAHASPPKLPSIFVAKIQASAEPVFVSVK